MPWCPVCKNEYKEGYTICADCKVPLVESLTDMPVPVYFGEEKDLLPMVDFLKANELTDAYVSYDEKEQQHEIYVKQDELEEAKKMLMFFLKEKHKEAMQNALKEKAAEVQGENAENTETAENTLAEFDPEENTLEESLRGKKPAVTKAYQDKHQKAEEYKSSAFALLFVGVLIVVFMVLNEIGILPFKVNFANNFLVYGVMGVMAVGFLVMGVYSIHQSKKIAALATEDDNKADRMKKSLHAAVTKEILETEFPAEIESEEQLYFVRTEYMKKILTDEYEQTDSELMEKLIDEYYEEMFS